MIKLVQQGVKVYSNKIVESPIKEDGYEKTMSYSILKAHNTLEETQKGGPLKIKFDAIASHDITYVGIIQTAKAIGLNKFPIPYVLTNCHNSLCAVGGTINEDDHVFGLSAAKKYGAIFVPPHLAVIHSYMREKMAAPLKMILGSDSHTRYGAIGTMAIGEGGPELVKQIIGKTYDITYPEIVGVNLKGRLRKGVGSQDVALTLIKATFKNGFVKNKVLEFFGEGLEGLSMEYRNGIDVMTTETACLSSVWATDEKTKEYLETHGRGSEFVEVSPKEGAYYDSYIELDLSKIEPMIALPFHPSNVYSIRELLENPAEILTKCQEEGRILTGVKSFTLTDKITKDGKIRVDQAIIAGCAGGLFDNLVEAANILEGKSVGSNLAFSVYPGSQAVYLDLVEKGVFSKLIKSGATIKTAFCGPCFGAGDVPSNNGLSIRHTTRNFPSREGSKPADGQIAAVALMDARSIAATCANDGYLTSALELDYDNSIPKFSFDNSVYAKRVYDGYGSADIEEKLIYGPNIADLPAQIPLTNNLFLKVCAVINDEVTTTDELIPSGETSSYRSNPLKLAEFTLSRKVPSYVKKAKDVKFVEENRRKCGIISDEYQNALDLIGEIKGDFSIGSVIFAKKPGDGSAREQAASCQRFLGGLANIAKEYATKRYRSNLINWGMLPLIYDNCFALLDDDIIVIKDTLSFIDTLNTTAYVVRGGDVFNIELSLNELTQNEKDIIKAGCLINYDRTN